MTDNTPTLVAVEAIVPYGKGCVKGCLGGALFGFLCAVGTSSVFGLITAYSKAGPSADAAYYTTAIQQMLSMGTVSYIAALTQIGMDLGMVAGQIGGVLRYAAKKTGAGYTPIKFGK